MSSRQGQTVCLKCNILAFRSFDFSPYLNSNHPAFVANRDNQFRTTFRSSATTHPNAVRLHSTRLSWQSFSEYHALACPDPVWTRHGEMTIRSPSGSCKVAFLPHSIRLFTIAIFAVMAFQHASARWTFCLLQF